MLRLTLSQIGLRHGEEAKEEIGRSIKFYAGLFKQTAKLSWDEVCQTAAKFLPYLRREWPQYVEEMNGEDGCLFSLHQLSFYPTDALSPLSVLGKILLARQDDE